MSSSIFALLSGLLAVNAVSLEERAAGGYVQIPSGTASFNIYAGCKTPACGKPVSGFSAAVSQLTFGSSPGQGPGDACGRCFSLTPTADPFFPSFKGPFHSIVVKVTDLCPNQAEQEWCGQSLSNPNNQHGKPFHFAICEDTGGSLVFFPDGHGELTGTFAEVSCSQWSGSDGSATASEACLSGEMAANWPVVACGNKGSTTLNYVWSGLLIIAQFSV